MNLENFNINDCTSLEEVHNINEEPIKELISKVKEAFEKLNINPDDMYMYYQRYNDGVSILAIKVSKGKNDDINNYMYNGCEVKYYNNHQMNCNISLHAKEKSGQISMNMANLISRDIVKFFNNFEANLYNDNLTNIELNILIPLQEKRSKQNKTKIEKGIKRLSRIFKRKKINKII